MPEAKSHPTFRSARMLVALGTALLITIGVAFLLAPERQQLGAARSGDTELAARVADAVGRTGGYRSLVVAEFTADTVTWAGLGNAEGGRRPGSAPIQDSTYEIGSITKTFTAALFADAIERGEVSPDDALATYLPELADTAAGKVTLESLAQHGSGLPGLGTTALLSGLTSALLNENPYQTTTTERLIADARQAMVDPDQPPTYSNFGFSLLGTALARAADVPDYQTLLSMRITEPLGMSRTVLAATEADVPSTAVPGFAFNGTPAPRWTGEGYLPSGSSTFSTITDIALWGQAQLAGTAPGLAALDPTADYAGEARIGWAWVTTPNGETDVVWHNGGTGGFRTMLALDRESGRGVVVMGNSTVEVDPLALQLLLGTPISPVQPVGAMATWITYGVAALLSVVALIQAWRTRAVLPMVGALLTAGFGLMLAWHSGPWSMVGGWAYGLLLAPALAALAITVIRAPALPWRPPRRAWLSWTGAVIALLLVIGTVFLW